MKTLELKDLKHYLGTGLKWTLQGLKTFTMSGLSEETLYTEEGSVLTWPKHPDLPQALFPCFIPLSALTEPLPDGSIPIVEIIKTQVNRNSGYSFNEVCDIEFHEKVDWSCGLDHFTLPCIWWKMNGYGYEIVLGKMCPMWITEYLYTNHFWLGDQSLFETGEIIDKRTLKQTP